MSQSAWKPTKAQLLAAEGKTVPDLLGSHLKVIFCGINPGLYSAAVKHHFARPGNRFWPALYAAGFTDRLLSPFEEQELLARGYGITNLVARGTASAAELSQHELVAGRHHLVRKIKQHRPKFLAICGVGAYRTAFEQRRATLGLQSECIGTTHLWVLPNPSGLNAHYQSSDLKQLFGDLYRAAQR